MSAWNRLREMLGIRFLFCYGCTSQSNTFAYCPPMFYVANNLLSHIIITTNFLPLDTYHWETSCSSRACESVSCLSATSTASSSDQTPTQIGKVQSVPYKSPGMSFHYGNGRFVFERAVCVRPITKDCAIWPITAVRAHGKEGFRETDSSNCFTWVV